MNIWKFVDRVLHGKKEKPIDPRWVELGLVDPKTKLTLPQQRLDKAIRDGKFDAQS